MKSRRIPCPECAELILPKAKKCRFCGKNLVKAQNNIPTEFLYRGWLLSMLIFFIGLFYIRRGIDSDLMMLSVFIIPVLFGMAFFISLIIKLLRKPKNKDHGRYKISTAIIFILFFAILLNYETIEARLGFSPPQIVNSTPAPTPRLTPTIQPTTIPSKMNQVDNSNQIECIGPDGKHFNTSMNNCINLNEKWDKTVDYMTNCNIQPECGGGTEYMSKSQCDKPCSGKTIKNNNSATTTQKTKSPSADFYCYDNANKYSYYTTSGEQCNADNARSLCLNSVKVFEYDPCMDTCLNNANDESIYCIYNLSESEQESCLDTNHDNHQKCMDVCSDISRTGNEKCY